MDYPKRAIVWTPKRSPKLKNGTPIPEEWIGKFRTRVSDDTPGAIHYAGLRSNGEAYSNYGLNVDTIKGSIRWIDKRQNDYGTKLVVLIENEKYLHQIEIDYDILDLRGIVNRLSGLKEKMADTVLNFSHWVRKAKNADGSFKTNDEGKVKWAYSVMIADCPQLFDNWREVSVEKGLDWISGRNAKGEKTINMDAEFQFWDSMILRIQRFLLANHSDKVLPFTWNSLIACEAQNPSGGGNLTAEEIERAKYIYDARKSDFLFSYGAKREDADDVFEQLPQPTPSARPVSAQQDQGETFTPSPTAPSANDYFASGAFTPSHTAPPANGFESLVEPMGAITDLGVGEGETDSLPF